MIDKPKTDDRPPLGSVTVSERSHRLIYPHTRTNTHKSTVTRVNSRRKSNVKLRLIFSKSYKMTNKTVEVLTSSTSYVTISGYFNVSPHTHTHTINIVSSSFRVKWLTDQRNNLDQVRRVRIVRLVTLLSQTFSPSLISTPSVRSSVLLSKV